MKFSSELEKYLSYSSSYFKKYFLEIYKILTPDKIWEIIFKIENERNMKFPILYKNKLIENYKLNYFKIAKIFDNLNKRGGLKQ